MNKIYLDHAATTLLVRSMDVMLPYFTQHL